MNLLYLFLIASLALPQRGNRGNLQLGLVDKQAAVKPAGETRWKPVSNEDAGMPLHLKDSVSVMGESLFIRELKNGKKRIYQADSGNWTVDDIIKGKAYHTHREKEKAADSVKGDLDQYFFDLIVNGKVCENFKYGDHPDIRVINNSNEPIYFCAVWLEGTSGWNILRDNNSILLPPHTSTYEESLESFLVGPPEGDAEVFLFVSEKPFSVQEAINSLSLNDNSFNSLVKRVTITKK